jgi:hypothetical protein
MKEVDKNRLTITVHPEAAQMMKDGLGEEYTPAGATDYHPQYPIESESIGPESKRWRIIDAREMKTVLGKRQRAGMQWLTDLYDVNLSKDVKKLTKAKAELRDVSSSGYKYDWSQEGTETDSYGDRLRVPVTHTLEMVNEQIELVRQALDNSEEQTLSVFLGREVPRDRWAPQGPKLNFALNDVITHLQTLRSLLVGGKTFAEALTEIKDSADGMPSIMKRLLGVAQTRIIGPTKTGVWQVPLDEKVNERIDNGL